MKKKYLFFLLVAPAAVVGDVSFVIGLPKKFAVFNENQFKKKYIPSFLSLLLTPTARRASLLSTLSLLPH
jgi:hypothetical protein